MNAYETLRAAQAAQINVSLEHDQLSLKGRGQLPKGLLELIKANKFGIMAILRPDDVVWSRADWTAYFRERAAKTEGEHTRTDAEFIALMDTIDRWLAVHLPQVSNPPLCSHCGKNVAASEKCFVKGASGQTGVLHAECASIWRTLRLIKAHTAVSGLLR